MDAGRFLAPDGGDVLGLGALRALDGLVLDLCALGERLVALTGDRAVVHEQILSLLLRREEPVARGIVDPLHRSCRHRKTPPLPTRERVAGGVEPARYALF